MNKRILPILLTILICVTLLPLPVSASAVKVAANYYNAGVVIVTGSGFSGGVGYTVRIVNTANSSIKALGQTKTDESGNLSAFITTGSLSGLSDFAVYVNNPDGTLKASTPIRGYVGGTTVSASYAGGVVTVTGTGFSSGAGYTVRVVDKVNSCIKTMKQVTAGSDRSISTRITTGELDILSNYSVYVNSPDGNLAGLADSITAEGLTDAEKVAADKAALVENLIKGTNTGLNNVTASLTLINSIQGGAGCTISWASSNTTIVSASGAVTRQTADVSVTLTATITSGHSSGTKQFTVTVKKVVADSLYPLATPTPTPTQQTNPNNTVTISTVLETTTDPATGTESAKVVTADIYSMTDMAKEAEAAGKEAVIDIKVETAVSEKAVDVVIRTDDLMHIADTTNADLKLETGIGTVTFDAKAVSTISGAAAAADIAISIKKVDSSTLSQDIQEKVADRPVYDFSITSGGSAISSFGGGNAQISIPYTLKPGEKNNSIVVYYIDSTGKLQVVTGMYNPDSKTVDFTTAHFSKYLIGYHEVVFSDVSKNVWYGEAVGFLAARDITGGVGGGRFAPDKTITRADFLVMAMKAYGIKPDAAATDNFADAGSKYYKSYLATAKTLGLVKGLGKNKFAPEATISRQDMFVILYSMLEKLNKLPTGKNVRTLGDFSDAGSITGYAKDAMKFFVEAGVAEGNGRNLTPKAYTTRAEVAKLLYNLLTK